jgi:hypothetical protein
MQIPDEVRKCVAFACCKTSAGMKLAGTAFFVGYPLGGSELNSVYIITAKHVIDGISKKSIDQKVHLRMNLKAGGVSFLGTPIKNWMFHPRESNVDVAVLNLAPSTDVVEYRAIPYAMAATEAVVQKEEIGVGDDVFLTGLFVTHCGSKRNIPIVRVGNIASMPEEKVHTQDLGDIDAYLIEARSIGGLSGSPVFAYLGAMRRIGSSIKMGRQGPLFYWIGLMHGHFDLSRYEMDELGEDSMTNLKINMGIAVVIPVWKILEVIDQEVFRKARESALEKSGRESVPGEG